MDRTAEIRGMDDRAFFCEMVNTDDYAAHPHWHCDTGHEDLPYPITTDRGNRDRKIELAKRFPKCRNCGWCYCPYHEGKGRTVGRKVRGDRHKTERKGRR